MKDKYNLYEASKVPEYWIVDPKHQDITIYALNDDFIYIGSRPFVIGDIVSSEDIDGLSIAVDDVFGK